MRILFVLANFYPYIGGSEQVFMQLAKGLVQRGNYVKVITSLLPKTTQFENIDGVEIQRVFVPLIARQYLYNFFCLSQVISVVKNFDVIQTASNYSALGAFIASRFIKKPVVMTCHEVLGKNWHIVEPSRYKSWLLSFIENVVVTLPYDQIITVSKATRNDLLKCRVNEKRIDLIRWGMEDFFPNTHYIPTGKLRDRIDINKDVFLYVFYGRPGATKGIEYLIKAAKIIRERLPNSRLVLIVSNEPKDKYQSVCNLVNQLGLNTYVHLLPSFASREDLAQNLVDANCLVIPSLTEGFGMTTAEACELGIPVVASNVGAIPEVIHGNYVLVPGGSPEGIAEGILRVFHHKFDPHRSKVKYTWEQTYSLYESLYQKLGESVK